MGEISTNRRMKLVFYKEDTWYADVPGVSKEECEMVQGAEVMLDVIAQSEARVRLKLTADVPEDEATIIKVDNTDDGGANYIFKEWMGIPYDYPIWLCRVTQLVFGYHPKTFKIQKL